MKEYNRFRTIGVLLVLIIGLSFISILGGCGTPSDSDLIPDNDYTETETANSITVRGVVESVESRNVYTTLGQMVRRVDVEAGDYVTAGQILAVLDTDNLTLTIAQQILNAESALEAAEINLAITQRDYDNALRDYTAGSNQAALDAESFLRAATIELDTSRRNYENSRVLYDAGAISREALLQAESAFAGAQSQYNNARASYENATLFQQRSLEQLRVLLQSANTAHRNAQEMLNVTRAAAEQDLNDATITAPISGTVTAVIAREGAVGVGRMFVIEDTDNLRIITSFREYDIGKVETGMEVTITSDATGNAVYTGVISRINPAATVGAPVVEFEAEITVTSVNTSLRIGTNARINIILE